MYFWAGPLQIVLIPYSSPPSAQTYATCTRRHSVILMTCEVAARSDESTSAAELGGLLVLTVIMARLFRK